MEQSPPFEMVTKLEAAERQLRVAIRLFFERRDRIAVHALAVASQEILTRLAQARGIKGMLGYAGEWVFPEKKKELFDAFAKAQNFFKHAAKDPDAKLKFYYEATKYVLYDGVMLCAALRGGFCPETMAYLGWFVSNHSAIPFKPGDRPLQISPEMITLVEDVRNVNWNNFDVVIEVIDTFQREGMPEVAKST